MQPLFRTAAVFLASAFVGAAQAQTPTTDDWQLVEVPRRKAVLATVQFDNGISLVSRCVDGVFEVTIQGLPEVRDHTRILRTAIGDEPVVDETWTVAVERSAAFSRLPAPLARRLAKGGSLNIVVPGAEGQPNRRYVMELSPSSAALDRTLSSCGRPLVDIRDTEIGRSAPDGLSDARLSWLRRPEAKYPESVGGQIALRGSVTVSCLTTAEGTAEDCVIESEHPAGFNFGRAVERSMRRARLAMSDGSSPAGRMFVFTTNFEMKY